MTRMMVVCGMPRSGTRNFVNALNTHGGINLTGEIPRAVMKRLFDAGNTVEKAYAGNDKYQKNWAAKKDQFLFEAMFSVSKSPRRRSVYRRRDLYAGTKTPNHEFLFKEYEAYFQKSELKPVYVFCARNPESCWKSYRSMPWAKRGVRSFVNQYVRSYRQLEKIRSEAPDRCLIANLDELIASDDQPQYLIESLFRPLKLDAGSDVLEKLAGLRNSNSTVAKTGSEPLAVPDSERRYIAKHRELTQIREVYFNFS